MAYVRDKETLEAQATAAARKKALESYVENADLTSTRQQITGRKAFGYDPTKDPLYLQMRDSYNRQGKLAMKDTLGQASMLNGGYNTSYAQSAGQQMYNKYMQDFNDVVPELAASARSNYDADTAALMEKYSLLYGEDADRRGQMRSDYETALNEYLNLDQANYNKYRDEVSDKQTAEQFAYQKERDKISDQQWKAQYDLSAASKSSGSKSGTTDASDDEYTYTKYKDVPADMTKKMSGMGSDALLKYLDGLYESKIISGDLAEVLYQTYSKDSAINAKDVNMFLKSLRG